MSVDLLSDIDAVKGSVEAREGVPRAAQRLVYGGRPLEAGVALAERGVGAGATLTLNLALRGGALLGKPVKGRSKQIGDLEEKYARLREFDVQNQKYLAARNELKVRRIMITTRFPSHSRTRPPARPFRVFLSFLPLSPIPPCKETMRVRVVHACVIAPRPSPGERAELSCVGQKGVGKIDMSLTVALGTMTHDACGVR